MWLMKPPQQSKSGFLFGHPGLSKDAGGRTHQIAKQKSFQTAVFFGTPLVKHESSEDFKGNNFSKTHILSQLTFLGLTWYLRKEEIRIAPWAQLQMEWQK